MNVSKTVRGVAGGGALVALLAALAQFKSWEEAAIWASSSVGGGLLLWGIVEASHKPLQHVFPKSYRTIKFYLAQVLAFAIPIGSYTAMVWLGWATWGFAGLIASVAAAYNLSQTIHWEEGDNPARTPNA